MLRRLFALLVWRNRDQRAEQQTIIDLQNTLIARTATSKPHPHPPPLTTATATATTTTAMCTTVAATMDQLTDSPVVWLAAVNELRQKVSEDTPGEVPTQEQEAALRPLVNTALQHIADLEHSVLEIFRRYSRSYCGKEAIVQAPERKLTQVKHDEFCIQKD